MEELRNEVNKLKHRLRVRNEVIQQLSSKIQGNSQIDLKSLAKQLEETKVAQQQAELRCQQLIDENKLLGETIKKIQEQCKGYTIQELQDTILSLNEEVEKLKALGNETSRKHEDIQEQSQALKLVCEELNQKLQDSQENAEDISQKLKKQMNQSKKLQQQLNKEQEANQQLQESYHQLITENLTHVEQIASLENKIKELNIKIYALENDQYKQLHEQRLAKAKRALQMQLSIGDPYKQEQVAIQVLKTELECEKAITEDLKIHIQKQVQEIETLNRNLQICRAQQLQALVKLDQESSKIKALEEIRLQDMKTIQKLERKHSQLYFNLICKYPFLTKVQ